MNCLRKTQKKLVVESGIGCVPLTRAATLISAMSATMGMSVTTMRAARTMCALLSVYNLKSQMRKHL